MVAWHLNGILK